MLSITYQFRPEFQGNDQDFCLNYFRSYSEVCFEVRLLDYSEFISSVYCSPIPQICAKKSIVKNYFFFVTTLISSGSGLGPETLVLEVIPAAVTVERLGTIHETRLL